MGLVDRQTETEEETERQRQRETETEAKPGLYTSVSDSPVATVRLPQGHPGWTNVKL